jgi:hypothetical protein
MCDEPSPGEADPGAPWSACDGTGGKRGYEPPRLTVLGTVAELTHGHSNTETDGITIGSIFT